MRTNVISVLTLLLLPFIGFITTATKEKSPKRPEAALAARFVPLWERAKAYTIEVAQAMPEEHYAHKPSEDVMSFGEQMTHIAQSIGGLSSGLLKGEENPFKDVSQVKTKAQTIELLNKSFDYMAAIVKSMPEAETAKMVNVNFLKADLSKEEIVYFIRDHTTHHRAQALVYLRDKGIKPPAYRGY
jgi:uncharacterized damage-inducible protein DinB